MNARNYRKRVIVVSLCLLLGFSAPAGAQSDWKKQWETTIEAGKKEGEVVIYGPHNPMYQQLWAVFQKSFSEIKFNFVPGKGADHYQRIVAERRAGKYLADLVMGGSSSFASFPPGTLEPLRPLLLLPEINDSSAWWDGKLHFADPQNQAAIIISGEVGHEAWFLQYQAAQSDGDPILVGSAATEMERQAR